jgi:hypothetical protein
MNVREKLGTSFAGRPCVRLSSARPPLAPHALPPRSFLGSPRVSAPGPRVRPTPSVAPSPIPCVLSSLAATLPNPNHRHRPPSSRRRRHHSSTPCPPIKQPLLSNHGITTSASRKPPVGRPRVAPPPRIRRPPYSSPSGPQRRRGWQPRVPP